MLTCVHVCTHTVEAHSLVDVHIRIFLFCMVNIALLSSPSSPFLILLSPSPSLALPPIPPHPPVFFPLSSPSLPFSCVEDPEWEWGIVCETMAAPETIRDTFLTESAVKSSFMCLFGAVLNELSQLKDPREELDMTIKMTNWCDRMKPELVQLTSHSPTPTRLLLSTYTNSTILTHPSSSTPHQTRTPSFLHPTHLTLPSLRPLHLPHPTQHTSLSHPHTPFILPTPPHMHSPILTPHTPHSSILTLHSTPSLPILVLPFPPSAPPA